MASTEPRPGWCVRPLFVLAALLAGAPAPAQSLAPEQPLASYWHPNTLLGWSPASDPDAPFNRSTTPLAARFRNPALDVNPHARPNEARVVALVSFGPTSNNPSQGSDTLNYYAVNYWQYIDVLVFWGGSASEGLILAPNATVIDAAHRNGVPVLGTVFLPPGAFGGQIQWVRDLVQKSGERFPVADRMIEVAEHYGFDGWFINQETGGGDAALAARLRDFIKYMRAHSSLRVMWYDSMVESGGIAWQNALNSSNDMFFEHGGRVADDVFLNFRWSASGLSSSRALAQSLGRSPYELYAGIDVEANGYNTSAGWSSLFPEGQPHVVSLGFYRPEWTYNSAGGSQAEFYSRDNRFWVGANRDPSNTVTSAAWKGVAHYVSAQSPITSLPFVTSFNTGQGNLYAVAGQVLRTRPWNNLSLQDVLPTWRWIVQTSGTRLTPDLDWSDAYEGGTSLKVSGSLKAANDLKLFETRLAIGTETSLRIAFKAGAAGPTRMQVGLAFEDDPASLQLLDVGSATGAGWDTRTFALGGFAGRTLAMIGLRFQSSKTIADYAMRVGQIAVYDGAPAAPAPPGAVVIDRKAQIDAGHAALRLHWPHSPDPVRSYYVYRRNPDGSSSYLGATPNNFYFVSEVARVGQEASTTIEVEAVAPDFGRSSRATTSFEWDGGQPPANLALSRPAAGSAACNANEGPGKAVNGSVSGGNSDKWCSLAATKFLQVDLGAGASVGRFVVKHAGAGGESGALNTRAFTIQLSGDGIGFTTVVTAAASSADVTTHTIAPQAARYVRLNVTTPTQNGDPAARIYELEVYAE